MTSKTKIAVIGLGYMELLVDQCTHPFEILVMTSKKIEFTV